MESIIVAGVEAARWMTSEIEIARVNVERRTRKRSSLKPRSKGRSRGDPLRERGGRKTEAIAMHLGTDATLWDVIRVVSAAVSFARSKRT